MHPKFVINALFYALLPSSLFTTEAPGVSRCFNLLRSRSSPVLIAVLTPVTGHSNKLQKGSEVTQIEHRVILPGNHKSSSVD